jgi:hypothetical protein
MSFVHLHLLLNHVPVVGVLFVVVLLGVAFWKRNSEIGKLALALMAGIAAVTAVVFLTGEPAEEAVEGVAGISDALIHQHEDVAQAALISTGVAGSFALGLIWWYRKQTLPRSLVATFLAVTIGIGGLMAWTANLGGQIRHSEIRSAGTAIGSEAERDSH